jgi:Uma2 family endonuclease
VESIDLEEASMTALPDWMLGGLTVADYDALPEEICRQIEVVDGAILVSPGPRRSYQVIARRLANLIEAACGESFTVATDIDLRLRDIPLLNRRPDIVVFDALVPDNTPLRPNHCLLVVEVMSPGSITTDQVDKPGEYAAAAIGHFWRVEFDDEHKPILFRYRLDPTARSYASAGAATGKVIVADPIDVQLDLDGLR